MRRRLLAERTAEMILKAVSAPEGARIADVVAALVRTGVSVTVSRTYVSLVSRELWAQGRVELHGRQAGDGTLTEAARAARRTAEPPKFYAHRITSPAGHAGVTSSPSASASPTASATTSPSTRPSPTDGSAA